MPDRLASKSTLAARRSSTTPAPVAAFVRLREVEARTGLSGKTIYRKMARGEFPKSVRLGANSVAWRESDLLEWMADPMGWASPEQPTSKVSGADCPALNPSDATKGAPDGQPE